MSKKWLMIIIGLVLGIGTGVGALFIFGNKTGGPNEEKSALSNLLPKPRATPEVTSTERFEHEAGFSFEYPSNVVIDDQTPSDDSAYAKLALSQAGSKGDFEIVDTTFKKLDDWLKTSNFTGAKLEGAVNLGGFSASQYSTDTLLITAAIDQGVLYVLSTPKQLQTTHDKIVETFAFAGTQNTNAASGSRGAVDDTIYEEEVVE